jgi:hypothetical protein
MLIEGSCQCGKVTFRADSETPVPFMYCFCSICRKCSGGAFGCNIMARRETLKVTGRRHLRVHHARIHRARKPTEISEGERWFGGACGTHLYLLDDRWPDGVWPNAGAVDTPLPVAPEHVFMMVRYKPKWVPERLLENGDKFPEYPKLSIDDWHQQHGLKRPRSAPASRRGPRRRSRAAG